MRDVLMDNGKNACILVVDDIPDTLGILVNWLEMQNFQTLSASNGKQAIELATEHLPDLILLDVMMPEMDGIETCRRLKSKTQTASIPVVLVTAKDPSDARADGMMAGAVDYITKPVNLNDLTARVEYVLSSHSEAAQVDVQRLLEEVAHSAMAMLDSVMVWLLTLDGETLAHQMLASSSGTRDEAQFIQLAANGHDKPFFSLGESGNPMVDVLTTRQITTNIPVNRLPETAVRKACEQLNLNYLTIVPLIAAGKIAGVPAPTRYFYHSGVRQQQR
jgi:DNA-binding response OmpR family regulator